MITEKLVVTTIEESKGEISRAAEIIRNGGLVAMPTETVYGLAANALNEKAVSDIFAAKGRPQDNPLIVHISNIEMLNNLVSDIPSVAQKCISKFWPGPFTAILPKSDIIPSSVCAGLDTIAIRMPSNPIARALIEKSGVPLAAPSANLSGSPSPTTAEHVLLDLDGKIDAVIMAGKSDVGVESTVVTFAVNPPRLLRPGGITAEQLRKIIPELVIDKAVFSEPEKGKPVASPGMKYKHYSPKANVIIIDSNAEKYAEYVNGHTGEDVYALCFDGDTESLVAPCISYGNENDSAEQATRLFDALRTLDNQGCKICYARMPKTQGVGLAVYNRLIRAAAFEVIKL
ncbi:MAG: L-threonylcarbamoyladenylate synthase [Oscillospiraceae bacterium]|nr:L-threonylcarbamoyladenylate synthase [Oscillospiraceae bacterium]